MLSNDLLDGPVLLVNAPAESAIYKEDRCQNDANDMVAKFSRPPVSLVYLAGVVERTGIEAAILDCPAYNLSMREFEHHVENKKPSVVIMNTAFQTLHEDMLALKIVKRHGALTIVFGYHATVKGRALLEEYSMIDFIIVKEPEETLEELLSGAKLASIRGLIYRTASDNVKVNDERPFIKDLNQLPFGSNHLLELKKYKNPLTGHPFAVIQVSRGCPFRCRFCLSSLMNGDRFRTRSVDHVLSEIKHVKNDLGIRHFFLRADTFTARKSWVNRFCMELIKQEIDIEWYTNTRIDTIRRSQIPLMARAGCKLFSIGVESGLPIHQELYGKNLKIDRIRQILSEIKKHGIFSVVYFLMGTPFDTRDTMEYNIRFSRTIDATFVEFTPFVSFEGIEMNIRRHNPSSGQIEAAEVSRYCKKGKVSFYLRPSKIMEMAKIFLEMILLHPKKITFHLKTLFNYGYRVLVK
ncbi:MAG: B12-binding domain-containing radical SAM protein [Promethearchaeota archaeon]